MSELFDSWSWQRKQPAPFDQYDENDLKRTDTISMYNSGPRKVATIHPVAIRAILAYMNLELGTKPPGQDRLGAIGSQGNDFTIAEYPSTSGEIHVVAFNRNRGTYKAGRYADPIAPTEKPSSYSYSENGNSGTALFFSLLPLAMADGEFNGAYQDLKVHAGNGFVNKEETIKAAALLCDNLYRRVRNADNLGDAGIHVKINAGGIIPAIRPMDITKGTLLATNVLYGDFEVVKADYAGSRPAAAIPHSEFIGKFILDEQRVLSPVEEATVPVLPKWYLIPPEIRLLCEHAKKTTGTTRAMRNFMLRGPAGTGKTEGAMAMAAAFHLPYRFYTCSAGTEVFDLIGQILPKMEKKDQRESVTFPTYTDIQMDPASAYYMLTEQYDETIDGDAVLDTLIHAVEEQTRQAAPGQNPAKEFEFTDTPLVEAFRYGYLLELQEPTVIANPAVLVGLNGLLDQCKSITLPTGEIVNRHPDAVIVITTNVDYAGCRGMNQSVISRMNLVVDLEEPDEVTLVKRVQGITGCTDTSAIKTMARIVKEINEYCQEASIRDGCCGVRELISWVQSYMITNDISEAAKFTVLSSASADGRSREEIRSRCLDTLLAA